MVNTWDFSWGEPFCVREALKHYYKKNFYQKVDIESMGYSLDGGHSKLIELTRQFIKESTGIDYKYIIITTGATGAINTVLRCLAASENKNKCFTHQYYFPYYPHILKKNNYIHEKGLYRDHEEQLSKVNTIGLVDSPSNPLGDLLLYTDNYNNIIWDSVYHNLVFINTIPIIPDHRVNCGSYSKVFGLTGVRIGWIATNNENDFNMFKQDNLHENCGISCVSQDFLIDVLENTDLYNFMKSSKYRINNNREMFDRICYLFDGQAVPENGMFYAAWASPYTVRMLDKLEIKSVEIDKLGNDKYLRFNLAQTNDLTKKAIRYIIKEDTR